MIQNKREQQYECFTAMPIAVAVFAVHQDVKSLRCIYKNQAFEQILQQRLGIQTKHWIPEFFQEMEERISHFVHQIAYDGGYQDVTLYREEEQLYFDISMYQSCYGHCVCMVEEKQDQVAYRHIEWLQSKLDMIVSKTTDFIFDLDLEHRVITNSEISIQTRKLCGKYIEDVPYGLVRRKFMKAKDVDTFLDMIHTIQEKPTQCSAEMEFRLNDEDEFRWYRMTLCSYVQFGTKQLQGIGFLCDITEEVLRRNSLESQALYDKLTSIYNRYGGETKIDDILRKQKLDNVNCMNAMFLFDLDNFKQANDQFGHMYGDYLLYQFAQILERCFGKDDILFRLGGDEFAVFCPNIEKSKVELLCHSILEHHDMEILKNIGVSVSIGVVVGAHSQYVSYYKDSDQAMYVVKKGNKNGYYIVVKD